MAFHKHFKLPPFKLTRRSSAGVHVQDLHRGVSPQRNLSDEGRCLDESEDPSRSIVVEPGICTHSQEQFDEPTLHELQSKASVKGWDILRRRMLSAAIESSAMPIGQLCLLCPALAVLRCQECGPLVHYCCDCFCKQHEKANLFHVAEKWEMDHYSQFLPENRQVNIRPSHHCDSSRKIPLQCLDEHGVEHSILFTCCGCEPLGITLVRAQLWPASPSHPRYAFDFKLLDCAESLLLECQVALKDFCQALHFRCPYPTSERREIYSTLIDSFEEYRFFKHDLRHLSFLSESLDPGNICPACPKNCGKVVYALDGLFGLPRKKSAGVSHRPAVHGSLFFCNQAAVDEFVAEAAPSKKPVQECNDFLAGSMLRSSTRFRALDETAVFGSACRHEFPALFCNLKHGERLAYSVWMIDRLLERHSHSEETAIYVMYDIACTLHRHLEICGKGDIFKKVHLCLPSFHSYGHKASCQIAYGPLRCDGIGLSDGETMERLWSFLRRFGRMTKEMRPAHRIDVLTHALVYYGMKTKDKLAHLLVSRWRRAHQISSAAEETFKKLTMSYEGGEVSQHTMEVWLQDEATLAREAPSRDTLPHWKCEYFLVLQSYLHLRETLSQSGQLQQEKLAVCREVARLNTRLSELEKQHHVSCRWTAKDDEFLRARHAFSAEKENQIAESMWASSVRRQFLLKLKAKYAEGQKIAKKLSTQVSKETKKMKTLLQEYNACQAVSGSINSLTLHDILDSSTLARLLQPKLCALTPDKQELINTYIMLKRTSEEICMLESEMANVTQYFEDRRDTIESTLMAIKPECAYTRGARALLLNLLQVTRLQVDKCRRLFSVCLHQLHSASLPEDDRDTEDSDSSSDDDDDI